MNDDDESMNLTRWPAGSMQPAPHDSPPPSTEAEVEFGARSRRGPRRSVNDDHYIILRLGRHQHTLMTSLPEGDVPKHFDEYGYGMVIADGMGATGEAASRLAISTLVRLAIYFGKWNVRVNEPIAEEVMDRVERFYRSVDSALLQAGHIIPGGLQTSLTAVVTAGTELFFAHTGHSRAYAFRGRELVQLTRDHTPQSEGPGGAAIVDIAAAAGDRFPLQIESLGRNVAGAPRIDVERFGLLDGDVILLCTNGLTDVVDDARIAHALQLHSTPDDQCRALMDSVAESHGSDDATALVAHYRFRI